ncbi:oxidoreductase [Pannonibacter phragmitetus]|uniref:Oxidoreductase n=1 Tax=Pannonibacter phragmitetus TaxID=121719 RepID=A0A0L0ISY8_9HYPH|nr:Gfo/Idh/MocA family oxidoreductase [Pannonibacter phragmitetus]ALV27332.1 oxidoreductase [Pannonibacter phragmitetus]KND16314.1 oxidoreductase [Pannonibacter phragmitetus]
MKTMKLGIIGCGNISDAYLTGGARSQIVSVKAVTDLNAEAARAKAEAYGVEAMTVEAMLADPEIEMIINLTVPQAHAAVSGSILTAGKHVYSEKPFAVTYAEAKEMVASADAKGLRIGSAPDTFLGAAHQRARELIDEGRIGKVVGGAVTFATPGMEMWHPNPFFFFQRGGGPVLDIGCYPITQLVNCLGPVESVVAHASRGRETRVITSEPHNGKELTVEVPTTVNGVLAFANGANVAFTASWDVWKHGRKPIEFYGTEGSILNPDPNFFGGEVLLSALNGEWEAQDISHLPFGAPNRPLRDGREVADYRMAGVFDMAAAIRTGRPHRANGALALHVLEIMESLERASDEGRRITLETTCERPQAVPHGTGEAVFL